MYQLLSPGAYWRSGAIALLPCAAAGPSGSSLSVELLREVGAEAVDLVVLQLLTPLLLPLALLLLSNGQPLLLSRDVLGGSKLSYTSRLLNDAGSRSLSARCSAMINLASGLMGTKGSGSGGGQQLLGCSRAGGSG